MHPKPQPCELATGPCVLGAIDLQGYLAHKKMPTPLGPDEKVVLRRVEGRTAQNPPLHSSLPPYGVVSPDRAHNLSEALLAHHVYVCLERPSGALPSEPSPWSHFATLPWIHSRSNVDSHQGNTPNASKYSSYTKVYLVIYDSG